MSFELSAAIARMARPISPFALPPKPVATRDWDVAHPPIIDAKATSEIAGPNRRALDIKLPLPFGFLGQSVELRHRSQELIDRVSEDRKSTRLNSSHRRSSH